MDNLKNEIFYEEFQLLAEEELKGALAVIPSDPIHRFLVFTEVIRVLDNWTVFIRSWGRCV